MLEIKETTYYILMLLIPFITYYIYYVVTTELVPLDFPPRVNECPDYWIYDTATDGCYGSNFNDDAYVTFDSNNINIGEIAGFNTGESDYNIIAQQSDGKWYFDFKSSDVCDKYNWANKYKIAWSGISNMNKEHCERSKELTKLNTSVSSFDKLRDYTSWKERTSKKRTKKFVENILNYIVYFTYVIGIFLVLYIGFSMEEFLPLKIKREKLNIFIILFVLFLFLFLNQKV